MKLIAKNQAFVKTLSRLISDYPKMAFAVAWASSGNEVYDLLTAHSARITCAVIGTHFYQTHPDVLDAFHDVSKVRFKLQPNGVFHPKVFVFWNEKTWEALVGSANLTTGAMRVNAEAILHISGTQDVGLSIKDELISLIHDYWQGAKRLTKAEAKAYRDVCALKQQALRRIAGQYGASSRGKPATNSSVMSMTWPKYFAEVKADKLHGCQPRCDLLASVRSGFEKQSSFAAMNIGLRKAIAGLPNKLERRWGWFGSMQGAGRYHKAVNNNDRHIAAAVDSIPLMGLVTRQMYDDYIAEFVKAFPLGKHGVALASRLLAMKRPDQFICLDAQNKDGLCRDFGIVKAGLDYDRYWDEIIERIRDAPWWNVKRPSNARQAEVWRGRVAMLDAIFYEQ